MYILLPPSETKQPGGAYPPLGEPALSAESPWRTLSFAEQLHDARSRVLRALEELSQDETAAVKALKLGAKSRAEIAHNLALQTSPTMPAIERYTGVLYDALGYETLTEAERAWIHTRVFIQSALFGLISAGDRIPAYRLSASSRLASLEKPLKRVWQDAHSGVFDPATLIIDARSKDYAGLAPFQQAYFLDVVEETEDGSKRALGHFNKAAKGDFVRRLARTRFDTNDIDAVLDWAHSEQLQLTVSDERTLTLVTDTQPGSIARRLSEGTRS